MPESAQKWIVGWLLLVTFMAPPGARAQTDASERISRVEMGLLPRAVPEGEAGKPMSIAQRMAYHGVPAMSIAVIEEGKVQWASAYGVTERGTDRRAAPQTLFQAASVSKPVSAVGALRLAGEGKISLDDNVNRWLRSWKVPESPLTADEKVTLRRLLNHTAGLTVDGFSGYEPGSALPTVQQILDGQPPANNAPVRVATVPGTKFSYSGGGYVEVQQLVIDVTGQPFDSYMRESVFQKLGMTSSTYEQPLTAARAATAASGYARDGTKLPGNWKIHPELAPAGLWTTPTDLAQVVIELQDSLAGRPSRVLTRDMAKQMLTAPTGNTGLGVFLVGGNGAARRFMHSGRNAGFDAMFVGYKNGRQGAVVMINRNNNGGFIEEVLESVAREYHWPGFATQPGQRQYISIFPEAMKSYAGLYETSGHLGLRIEVVDGHLFAKPGEDAWMPLFPASQTEFFSAQSDGTWIFTKDGVSRAREVIRRSNDREVRWTRVR
jgi:CubicO group peptidase (beta-lactamase class C family)